MYLVIMDCPDETDLNLEGFPPIPVMNHDTLLVTEVVTRYRLYDEALKPTIYKRLVEVDGNRSG